MATDPIALVHRFLEEAWNKRKLAVVNKLFAADYVAHDPVPAVTGTDDRKQFIAACLTAFPDLSVIVEDCFAAAEKVAVRWTARGTHTGQFLGIAPTERQAAVAGISIYRVAEGRIAESWVHWDSAGLVHQLSSVLPTEPATGA